MSPSCAKYSVLRTVPLYVGNCPKSTFPNTVVTDPGGTGFKLKYEGSVKKSMETEYPMEKRYFAVVS